MTEDEGFNAYGMKKLGLHHVPKQQHFDPMEAIIAAWHRPPIPSEQSINPIQQPLIPIEQSINPRQQPLIPRQQPIDAIQRPLIPTQQSIELSLESFKLGQAQRKKLQQCSDDEMQSTNASKTFGQHLDNSNDEPSEKFSQTFGKQLDDTSSDLSSKKSFKSRNSRGKPKCSKTGRCQKKTIKKDQKYQKTRFRVAKPAPEVMKTY